MRLSGLQAAGAAGRCRAPCGRTGAEHLCGRRAVVHKRRYRYTLGGCSAEIDRLLVDGKPLESCAVESRDPQAVLEAVGRLRLTGEDNCSYAQMLCDAARDNA